MDLSISESITDQIQSRFYVNRFSSFSNRELFIFVNSSSSFACSICGYPTITRIKRSSKISMSVLVTIKKCIHEVLIKKMQILTELGWFIKRLMKKMKIIIRGERVYFLNRIGFYVFGLLLSNKSVAGRFMSHDSGPQMATRTQLREKHRDNYLPISKVSLQKSSSKLHNWVDVHSLLLNNWY